METPRAEVRIPAAGPRPDEMLPVFNLPTARGGTFDPWQLKGRRNLVLVFAGDVRGDAERRLLRELAGRYAEYQEEETEVVGVVALPTDGARRLADEIGLPYPVAADADGMAHARFGAVGAGGQPAPAVYVADRYGVVHDRWIAPEGGSGLPSQEQMLELVRFLEIQCPE